MENASVILTENRTLFPWEMIIFLAKEYANHSFSTAVGFKDLSPETQDFFKMKFPHEQASDLLNLEADQLEKAPEIFLTVLFQLICLLNNPPIAETVLPVMEQMMDRQVEETAQLYGTPQISLDNTMGTKELLRETMNQINNTGDHFSVKAIESLVAGFETNCTEEKLKEKYDYQLSIAGMADLYKSGELKPEGIKLTKEWKARHDIWFPKIQKALQEQSNVFVAAGMAHFIGPYNILNLLKQENFSIKRFNSKCLVE